MKFTSTLETRIRYASSDCLETFSFPTNNPLEALGELELIGERFYLERKNILLARQIGLTDCYNLFHDPNSIDSDIIVCRAFKKIDQIIQVSREIIKKPQ